jgi:DNA-binding HxlR family transcriptional regulator
MSSAYYQFCPVAKAMEMLDERWSLLIIRELMSGSERFNELRRGLPRISPTLLSKRLHALVRAGLVDQLGTSAEPRYLLSGAGAELRPIVEAVGAWGIRWMGEIGDADLDPKLLLWDMHRRVDHTAVPSRRTVVYFRFPDAPAATRDWWLVINDGQADVCDRDPGHAVDVSVTGRLRAVVDIWRGDLSWPDAQRTGSITVDGPSELRRAFPRWFLLSPFATVPRPPALVSAG